MFLQPVDEVGRVEARFLPAVMVDRVVDGGRRCRRPRAQADDAP
ncbi:MAG: hypothetical protein ACLT98_13155 [Eggerthellaceae bacterium]